MTAPTDEEILAKAGDLILAGSFNMRSCHECNTAHAHFTNDEDCVILCFICGRYWLGAHDLSAAHERVDPRPHMG